jgi:hypothetical protein
MKLRDLEAYFTKYVERAVPSDQFVDGIKHPDGIERSYHRVATLAEADGIWFLCPKCFAANGGRVGTHTVGVGFTNAPPGSYMKDLQGRDTRWQVISGAGLDDLVLSPSILLLTHENPPPSWFCAWHGFVGSSGVPPGEAA